MIKNININKLEVIKSLVEGIRSIDKDTDELNRVVKIKTVGGYNLLVTKFVFNEDGIRIEYDRADQDTIESLKESKEITHDDFFGIYSDGVDILMPEDDCIEGEFDYESIEQSDTQYLVSEFLGGKYFIDITLYTDDYYKQLINFYYSDEMEMYII